MVQKLLIMIAAGIALATANAPAAMAQDVLGTGLSPTSTLPVTEVTGATDGTRNFKSFTVEAPAAGAYYAGFWLLPSRYADNSCSPFSVYVNGNFAGTITPTAGNWQSARVGGNGALSLAEGANVISIAVPAPEFPEVETVKVARNDADATFSPEAYREYLADAEEGVACDIPGDDGMAVFTNDAASANLVQFSNVPLNYTFYKTFSFTKGSEILITSSSVAKHKIDVIYYGSDPFPTVDPGVTVPENSGPSAQNLGIDTGMVKATVPYIPATSDEMQGLGFVFPSEKALDSSLQVAVGKVKIPKSGQYLVRVRHVENGGTALAQVNVNGRYFYENVPITLSYKQYIIQADKTYYATYTLCDNIGTDDPYLFIHGADCDRIVGFNDDCPSAKKDRHNLSAWDSYISQIYSVRTSGISVCNFSSSRPKSYCDIMAGLSEEPVPSMDLPGSRGSNATAGLCGQSVTEESVRIAVPNNTGGSFSIAAAGRIQKVSVYGLEGNLLGSVNCRESSADIPASSLNINRPGIYVVCVETADGVTSRKVVVNK